jgi:hypothetical protein
LVPKYVSSLPAYLFKYKVEQDAETSVDETSTPYEALRIKDVIKLSDKAYNQFRIALNLQKHLPTLTNVINLRQSLDLLIVKGMHHSKLLSNF